jgi:hypothetical protein
MQPYGMDTSRFNTFRRNSANYRGLKDGKIATLTRVEHRRARRSARFEIEEQLSTIDELAEAIHEEEMQKMDEADWRDMDWDPFDPWDHLVDDRYDDDVDAPYPVTECPEDWEWIYTQAILEREDDRRLRLDLADFGIV